MVLGAGIMKNQWSNILDEDVHQWGWKQGMAFPARARAVAEGAQRLPFGIIGLFHFIILKGFHVFLGSQNSQMLRAHAPLCPEVAL